MSRRRGRTVAGTSAKKNRAARRHARSEADRWRRAGAAPPHALADPDQLSQLAQDHRDRREDPDAE